MNKRLEYTYPEPANYTVHAFAVANTACKDKRPPKLTPATLSRRWLPTLDTLRNFLLVPAIGVIRLTSKSTKPGWKSENDFNLRIGPPIETR